MKKGYRVWAMILTLFMLVGCASQAPSKTGEAAPETTSAPQENPYTAPGPGDYDSVDTAIVVKKDSGAKTISFRNLETGRQYTLSYDGTSVLTDRNDQPLSMEQIAPGDIVDVTFLRTPKTLTTLKQSATAFRYQTVTDFEISDSGRSITINGSKFRLDEDAVVITGGELGSVMDINEYDTLTIKGFDKEVHSIVIEKGHGYLRLLNDESFIGGFIEVGSFTIVPITENMLLTVPEGTYDISVSHGGSGGTKSVTICRNEEHTMDVGDLVTEAKEGSVLFDITPSDATIYIDGEKVDTSEAITLTYGIHQLIVRADGYETLSKYIRVGQPMATLVMEMEIASDANADEDDETDSEEDESADSDSENTDESDSDAEEDSTGDEENGSDGEDASDDEAVGEDEIIRADDGSNYYVVIGAPEGAEVYVDGVYVGLAPVSFAKVAGSHVLTFRQTGYQTRSYTIELDAEKKDVSYSFSELIPIE